MFRRALLIVMLLSLAGCSWFMPKSVDVPQYRVPPEGVSLLLMDVTDAPDDPSGAPPVSIGTGDCDDPEQEYRICVEQWTRDADSTPGIERITLDIRAGSEATSFYIIFAGYQPYQEVGYVTQSETYTVPPYWSSSLFFEIPVDGLSRLILAQVWGAAPGDSALSILAMPFFVPPCPGDDYLWPDGFTKEDCIAEYH